MRIPYAVVYIVCSPNSLACEMCSSMYHFMLGIYTILRIRCTIVRWHFLHTHTLELFKFVYLESLSRGEIGCGEISADQDYGKCCSLPG